MRGYSIGSVGDYNLSPEDKETFLKAKVQIIPRGKVEAVFADSLPSDSPLDPIYLFTENLKDPRYVYDNTFMMRNMVARKKKLLKILLKPLRVREVKAPKDTECLKCHSKNVVVLRAPVDHWASGRIKCKDCGNIVSVWYYLGEKMVSIEPLEE